MVNWRLVAGAVLLTVTAGAALASAQTVYVRNAKPGETVEVVLNGTTEGSAAADQGGEVRLPLDLSKASKPDIDANIYIDSCDRARRVIIVERGATVPPPEPGGNCTRRDTPGIFWVRAVNTIVVDLSPEANPSLLLVKGTYTPRDVAESEGAAPSRYASNGLALFGGGAWDTWADAVTSACGNADTCSGSGKGFGFTVGGTYWINKYIGVEGAYLRPKQVNASGAGTGYAFTHSMKADVVTITGKVGVTPGIVRVYGQGGMNYHQATQDTSETIPNKTITIDGVDTLIPGGTQTFQLKTQGWGTVFGGGLEVWVKRSLALYGEANFAHIKGDRVGGGPEGAIDDTLTYVTFGAKFRLGGGAAVQ